MSVAKTWGSTPEERAGRFACDDLIPNADAMYFRAVDFAGPPSVMFRWLCQLRAAPYSYDWVDNGVRRSPRELTPGLEQLEVGQRVMRIFELASFAPDRHITIMLDVPRAKRWVRRGCRDLRGTSRTAGSEASGRHSHGVMKWLLPWGDLIMMRKQLLTLKRLAES